LLGGGRGGRYCEILTANPIDGQCN